ncbi:MAG: hypothetical protein J1E62_07915 [Lachnospiraceae bacterium]|nr:hypothetical protein [Lachnospiraceae bacterium]
MDDQAKFLESLEEIKNIAKTQGGILSKEEIRTYLGDMDLSEEKMQAVYQYLGAHRIKVEGYQYKPDPEMLRAMAQTQAEKTVDGEAYTEERSSASMTGSRVASGRPAQNSRLYRKEVTALQQDSPLVSDEDILAFLKGRSDLRNRMIESRLEYVIKLSGKYRKRGVPKEELIAEGNLGLLEGMRVVEADARRYIKADGTADADAFWGTIEIEAKQAMERYIDSETENKDQESAMLAKTNLLHEATKYMAEEMGRIPTVEELSEYTRISVIEILQIMGLSEDAARVANTTEVNLPSAASQDGESKGTDVTEIFRRRGENQ